MHSFNFFKKADIIEEAKRYQKEAIDIVEWRADIFEEVENHAAVLEVLNDLVNVLKGIPLIFTFRSHQEGEKELSKEAYVSLNQFVIQTGLADFVDVELYQGEDTVKHLTSIAHLQHTYVIISNHDFQKTPPKSEIINRLKRADELGGDVLKIAVMPNKTEDVLELLTATNEMKKHTKKPMITMAMGTWSYHPIIRAGFWFSTNLWSRRKSFGAGTNSSSESASSTRCY